MLCNVLGMLGNVLGRPRHALQGPRHACKVLGMLATSLADLSMLLQGPRSIWNLVVYYFLSFTAYKAASGGGGFLFDVGLLGPYRSMPRSAKGLAKHAKDLAKHAENIAKHAEVRRGRCQACLGVAKQAYTS